MKYTRGHIFKDQVKKRYIMHTRFSSMDRRCPISYWFDFTIGCSCFLLKKSISFFLKKKSRKEGNIFEAQIKLDIGNLVKEMLKIKLGMH